MHKKLLGLAAALTLAAPVLATPAHANETRFEVRASGQWIDGQFKSGLGAAAGYDFTLAPGAFVGGEVSLDKILGAGALSTLGLTGRAGLDVPLVGKIYGLAGYATRPYHGTRSDWDFGVGIEHHLVEMAYGKLEYRHYTGEGNGRTPSRDAVLLGVGASF